MEGEGIIRWTFRDGYGFNQEIIVKAYYIPSCSIQLVSPKTYFKRAGSLNLDKDGCKLSFTPGKQLIFDYAIGYKLTVSYATNKKCMPSAFWSLQSTGQLNISKAQEDLLLGNSIFGYFYIKSIKQLIVKGGVKVKESGDATCNIPLFMPCISGKGRWVGLKITKKVPNAENFDVLKKGDLQPGDKVNTDQYECRVNLASHIQKRRKTPRRF